MPEFGEHLTQRTHQVMSSADIFGWQITGLKHRNNLLIAHLRHLSNRHEIRIEIEIVPYPLINVVDATLYVESLNHFLDLVDHTFARMRLTQLGWVSAMETDEWGGRGVAELRLKRSSKNASSLLNGLLASFNKIKHAADRARELEQQFAEFIRQM